MKPWIAVIAAAVVIAAGLSAAVATGVFQTARTTTATMTTATEAPPFTPASTTTSTTSLTRLVSVPVPIVVCDTTFGISPPPTPVAQPASVTLSVPPYLVDKLSLYSDNRGIMRLLGPSGWQCEAKYGADGSGGLSVYPSGTSPPAGRPFMASSAQGIVGSETSACASCTLGQACPLFPAAAADYARDGYNPAGCLARPATETVDPLSTGVVAFQDPPGLAGDGNPSGGSYAANGVMTFYPGSSPGVATPTGSWLDTCTLPAATQQLCTVALDEFVSDYGSK